MKEIIKDLTALSEPSEQLTFIDKDGNHKEEGQEIIKDLKGVMEADKSVLALAAPQIGINKRIFGIRFEDAIKIFINPIITKKANYKVSIEGCASLPGKEILTARPEEITTVYYNEDFKYEDNKLSGYAARIFDQQINILDGVLPTEIGLVSDIKENGAFADLSEEEVTEAVKLYHEFIKIKSTALSKVLSEDTDLKDTYKRMKFAEDVINGRTQVIENPNEKLITGNREQRRAALKDIKNTHSKTKQKLDAKKGKK